MLREKFALTLSFVSYQNHTQKEGKKKQSPFEIRPKFAVYFISQQAGKSRSTYQIWKVRL